MAFKNSPDQYGFIAKGFHWVSALIVLGLMALGFYMVSLEFSPFKLDLYWWHKSFGTLIFFLVLLRLIWRFVSSPPAHVETHQPWERSLARIVHVLLYVGMIGMPVSGILMSAAADFPRPFFGLFEIPDMVEGKNDPLFNRMKLLHEVFAYCLYVAIGLHGLGAFKHHILDKDVTLSRMLPAVMPRLNFILSLLFFAALMGASSLLIARHLLKEEQAVAPQAQAEAAAKDDTGAESADANAPQWHIIPDESRIGFQAIVQGKDFEGQFTEFDGDIFFDPDNLEASHVDVRAQIASVKTGSGQYDEYIVMEPWLFAESFPESYFTASEFKKIDENQYVASGVLSIRGVALPVDVPFTLDFSEDEAGKRLVQMDGGFTLNRLDYGIGTGDWSSPEMVENALGVSVSIKAWIE